MGFYGVERVLYRRRPSHCPTFQRSGKGQMTLSAYDEVRLRDELSRGRSDPFEPVLADADEAKPAFASHGAAP